MDFKEFLKREQQSLPIDQKADAYNRTMTTKSDAFHAPLF